MTNEEYYVVPVCGDESEHDNETPFCHDMTCPCHEDEEAIGQMGQYYNDGFVTTGEADRIYRGQVI